MEKRVFVSVIRDQELEDFQRVFKGAVLKKIRDVGLVPQEFMQSGIPQNLAWSFENVDRVMQRCVGAVVIGFPRWRVSSLVQLVSEYNHYEGAVALSRGLPVLLLAESGVQNRGVLWQGGGKIITTFPSHATADWVDDVEFTKPFEAWRKEIESRKDVFLGYCSKSAGTAAQIEIRLARLGASVLNWEMDFRTGTSILNEIENARACCSCGIFLFSEDDPLEGESGGAAPRDNVVFEAGYFMSSKGAERCLIVREGKAKMPADLGGTIYVDLEKGGNIATIEGRLASFLKDNF